MLLKRAQREREREDALLPLHSLASPVLSKSEEAKQKAKEARESKAHDGTRTARFNFQPKCSEHAWTCAYVTQAGYSEDPDSTPAQEDTTASDMLFHLQLCGPYFVFLRAGDSQSEVQRSRGVGVGNAPCLCPIMNRTGVLTGLLEVLSCGDGRVRKLLLAQI